ncbi:hypothetical protein ABT010_06720 [Streptomyces sp. NPDC002668]|uniref:hypothetical protein n=1 Tax=Streptomyces sp. NPDC002668 TaxID=3154422 RepID=UPI0033271193
MTNRTGTTPGLWLPGALPPARDPRTHDGKAVVVRIVAGVLLVPLLMIDMFFVGLSPMATDSCGPDNCSDALNQSLIAAPVFWLAAVVMLLVTWGLPARPRFRAARGWLAVASGVSGLATIAILANLPTG